MAKSDQASGLNWPVAATHPSSGGAAPGNAPSKVQCGERVLSGVYTNRYATSVTAPMAALNRLTIAASATMPAATQATPRMVTHARSGVAAPAEPSQNPAQATATTSAATRGLVSSQQAVSF